MFPIGVNEALCVALFTALVWAAHTALRVLLSSGDTQPRYALPKGLRRNLLVAAGALAASFLVGLVFARPLWTAAVEALPWSASSTQTVEAVRFQIPLLIAIFLSSPAWTTILLRLADPDREIGRAWLLPSVTFLSGGILGCLTVLPYAARSLVGGRHSASVLWDATAGPALILLAAPLSFRAARPRLPTARRWVLLTPLLMLVAALGTATSDVFTLVVVFLPMCVACMAGIVTAEVANALSKEVRVPITKVMAWAVRLSAESILAAAIALVILWR
jgi:Sec-independent protein secretion pathway component TatC